MVKKIAIIDYEKCRPGECESGCLAAKACKRRSLKQEDCGQPPFNMGLCSGCFSCVNSCPLEAIQRSK
ncbi:MAG: hypothetical protein ACQEP5_06810 [Actinomycetota bacterium]